MWAPGALCRTRGGGTTRTRAASGSGAPVHRMRDALIASAALTLINERSVHAKEAGVAKHQPAACLDDHTNLVAAPTRLRLVGHLKAAAFADAQEAPAVWATTHIACTLLAHNLNAPRAETCRRSRRNRTARQVGDLALGIVIQADGA